MRNLKRALSLALATIMVMSMMVVGAGATSYDDFSDKDKIVNKEAVTVLTTLNVINGKDDGTYDPEGIVTRAEMAKIICVALNGGQDPALGDATTHTYTDTIGHWAEAYIEYCTQLGIVAGKGNGTFDPNATVTGAEAAKMLLVALGYNAQYEGMVGASWAIATNVLANQNKLYAGAVINPNDGLSRDNAAQMTYNALNAEMVRYDFALVTGNNGSITSIPTVEKKSATLLSDKFGGVRVEGVVVRNEQTAANFDGKTRVEITNEDELAKVGHNFGDTATFNMTTDASLLGTSVFFYAVPSVASPSNSEKATILGSVMDSGKNVVVTTTKTFGDDGVKGFMKDNDINATGAVVYVNGAVTDTAVSALVNQTGCEINFIDNDNDGITEAVVKTNYSFGKVTKYSTKDDGTLTIDTYADSKDYKSAKIVGFDEVAKDDYVVYTSMGGKLYVAKAETIEGTLETYKNNSNRLKANLTVDGTSYTFSESSNYNGKDGELKNPDNFLDNSYMGKKITLYLDEFGYVAAVSDVQGFTDYAYVANASVNNDGSGLAGDARVYVALADGTSSSYIVKNYKDGSWSGKPTGVTGDKDLTDDSNLHNIVVGNVYGYYLTSDGKIELTNVTNNATVNGSGNNIKFDKGSSTIAAGSLLSNMTDNNTVFFYVMMEVDGSGAPTSTVKTIESYVGKDKAPSVKVTSGTANTSVYTVPSRKDASIAGAVVFQVGEVASANVLYLYQYVKSTNENTIYNAVIDGKLVEGITVDSKDTTLAGAPYVYTMTSKGYYNLTNVTTTSNISGYVTLSEGKSVVINDPITGTSQEVKIVSDTSMAEIDGGDTAIITNVTEKDWVTVVYNPNTNDALGIYLEERYTNDNTSVLGIDNSVSTVVKKSTTSGYKYDVTDSTAVSAVLDDVAISHGATAYITYTKPANLAAAKAYTGLLSGDTTLTNVDAYLVVLAEDETAYSTYKLKVGTGGNAPLPASAMPTASISGNDTLDTNGGVVATVTATGTGTLTYEWFEVVGGAETALGSAYSGTTTKELSVDNTIDTAAHTYRCKVTNTETGKSGATLSVDVDVTASVVPETIMVTIPKAYTDLEVYIGNDKATLTEGFENYTLEVEAGKTVGVKSTALTAGARYIVVTGEAPVTATANGASGAVKFEDVSSDLTLAAPVQVYKVTVPGNTSVLADLGNATVTWTVDGEAVTTDGDHDLVKGKTIVATVSLDADGFTTAKVNATLTADGTPTAVAAIRTATNDPDSAGVATKSGAAITFPGNGKAYTTGVFTFTWTVNNADITDIGFTVDNT